MEESYELKEGQKRCKKNYKFHKRTNRCRLKSAESPPYEDGTYIRVGSRCKNGFKYRKSTNRCVPVKRKLVLLPRTPTPEFHSPMSSKKSSKYYTPTMKSKSKPRSWKYASLPSVLPVPSPSGLPETPLPSPSPSPQGKFGWFFKGRTQKSKSKKNKKSSSPPPSAWF